MKRKTITTIMLTLFLTSILSVTLPVSAVNNDIVVNGGFEQPVVTDTARWGIFTSAEINGWTVEWLEGSGDGKPPVLELQRSGLVVDSFEGNQHAELDTDLGSVPSPEKASVRIYQYLETVPGGVYELSFAYRPRPGYSCELSVYWDGESVVVLRGVGVVDWKPYNTTVTASSIETCLQFEETGPPDSFGMLLDAVSVVLEYIEVDIDIKPGSDPNSVNPDANGLLPVAILGGEFFDVSEIDLEKPITLGSASLATRGAKAPKLACSYEDVNDDGYMDLMTFFPVADLGLTADTDLTLTAYLLDGTPIVGSDSVRVVPPE